MDAIQGSEVLALVGEEILFNWIFGYCVKRQRAPNSFVLEAEVLLWSENIIRSGYSPMPQPSFIFANAS